MSKKKEIIGLLGPYFETGMEGVSFTIYDREYMVEDDSRRVYEGLHHLRTLDHLTIYQKGTKPEDNKILWEGLLDFSSEKVEAYKTPRGRSVGYKAYPDNPKYGQLQIAGMWVHQLPTNIDMDLWIDIFFINDDKYWAKLVKRPSLSQRKDLH